MIPLDSLFFFLSISSVFLPHGDCLMERKRYDGYFLVNISPSTSEESDFVETLLTATGTDVWDKRRNGHFQVAVPPGVKERVLNTLFDNEIHWELIHPDLQELVDTEQDLIAMRRLERSETDQARAYDYENFNSYDDYQAELLALADRCPSGFECEVFSIGESYEGKQLNVFRIFNPDEDRKLVWIESMLHAREWLAGATHMRILNHLVSNYSNDADVTEMLDNYDFYMFPAMNPDGYIYSWDTERLWRKNRTPNTDPECPGTDLNRNFEHAWGGPGSSDDPCSNTFRGASAGSEPVTQAVQEQMNGLGADMHAYVSMHTYGKLFMFPWAYTDEDGNCAKTDDFDNLLQVATAAADAANGAGDGGWVAGTWCDILYVSSGCSQDHARGGSNITYSFTPELRGDNFIVPPSEIEPSFREVWASLVAMIREIEAVEEGL